MFQVDESQAETGTKLPPRRVEAPESAGGMRRKTMTDRTILVMGGAHVDRRGRISGETAPGALA